jgi:hypothetical protein
MHSVVYTPGGRGKRQETRDNALLCHNPQAYILTRCHIHMMRATANLPLAKSPAVTLPPDLGSGRSSGCSQTQLRPGSSNLDASQTLCKKVSGHVGCGHVVQHNLTRHNNVVQPVEAQVEVLHVSVVLGVLANLNCRLIVQKQEGRARDGEAKLPQQCAHPNNLLASRGSGNKLSLCGGEGHNGLKARRPLDGARADLDDVHTRRAAVVQVRAVISVGVHVERIGCGWLGLVREAEVAGAA